MIFNIVFSYLSEGGQACPDERCSLEETAQCSAYIEKTPKYILYNYTFLCAFISDGVSTKLPALFRKSLVALNACFGPFTPERTRRSGPWAPTHFFDGILQTCNAWLRGLAPRFQSRKTRVENYNVPPLNPKLFSRVTVKSCYFIICNFK